MVLTRNSPFRPTLDCDQTNLLAIQYILLFAHYFFSSINQKLLYHSFLLMYVG